MDLSIFFQSVRRSVFGGSLTKGQVEGMEKIIDYWLTKYQSMSLDQFAYLLATVAWETGRKMVPVREAGGENYLRRKRYYPWVGEGLVQVTWEVNHRKLGGKKPGDLLQWPIALHAAFFGMATGIFTGKKLSDYINTYQNDYMQARRIINGMDRAGEIAAYAKAFRQALIAANAVTDPVIPTEDKGATLADISEFKERLLYLFENDEDVRAAVIAIVFPDDNGEIAGNFPLDGSAEQLSENMGIDPLDEPHEEYGFDDTMREQMDPV